MNKKIIALIEDNTLLLERLVEGSLKLTSLQLRELLAHIGAMQAVQPSFRIEDIRRILGTLGIVYEVPFSDGRKTILVVLIYKGIKRLGIDPKEVFRQYGVRQEFDEKRNVRKEVLVGLDLYQQLALLDAIVKRLPRLRGRLGFYNLRGSKKAYEVLYRENIQRRLGIYWIPTGEVFVPGQAEEYYPEEGIITQITLKSIRGYRFTNRCLNNGIFDNDNPENYYNNAAVIFGVQI